MIDTPSKGWAGWRRLGRLLYGKTGLWTLLPIIIALAASAALNVSYNRTLADTRELVAHSLRVNTAINEVLSTMQDIETGQRGYLITGNSNYLAPYRAALGALEPRLSSLQALVRDNSGQSERVDQARTLSRIKLAEVDATIEAMRHGGFDAARPLVASDEGKRTMDSFRAVVGQMREAEGRLLDARIQAMQDTEHWLYAVAGLGIAIAICARLVAFALRVRIRRQKRVRASVE